MHIQLHAYVHTYIHIYTHIYIYIYISEVGGVVQALVLPPNREIDFDFDFDCVACVRASEAA